MKTLFNIPTPCGENWDAMTPTACGRFCNVCQKEVIDITHMTDEAVTQKLEERGGQMCIHAKATQVIAGRVFPQRRLALFALALWAVFSCGLIEEVQGQDSLQTAQTDTAQYGMVKIKVVDVEDKQPVNGAKIRIRDVANDTTYFVGYTDSSGIATFPKVIKGNYKLWIKPAPKTGIRTTTVEMAVHHAVNDYYIEVITEEKEAPLMWGKLLIGGSTELKEVRRLSGKSEAIIVGGCAGVIQSYYSPLPRVIDFSRRYPTREFHPDLHR